MSTNEMTHKSNLNVFGLSALLALVCIVTLVATLTQGLRAQVVVPVDPEPNCYRVVSDGVCGNPCPGGTVTCTDGTVGPTCQDSPTPPKYKCLGGEPRGYEDCDLSGKVAYWRQYYVCEPDGSGETTYWPDGDKIELECASAKATGSCGPSNQLSD